MFKLISKTLAAVAMVSVALFGSANAKTLKIETHFTASSPNGEVAAQFAKRREVFWRKLKSRNVLLIISNR